MRILMLFCNNFPYPPTRGATEGRTFNLLKYLHQHHEVTLFARRIENITDTEVEELRSFTSHLVLFPPREINRTQKGRVGVISKASRFMKGLFQMTPVSVLSYYSPEIQSKIDEYVDQKKCDLILCAQSISEVFIRPEYRQQVKTIVDIHSSIYGWVRNHLEKGASEYPLRDFLYLPLLYRYEQRYCAKFSRLVATTEEDRQQLLKISPNAQIALVPNGVDLEMFPCRPQDPGGHSLIFVGSMSSTHNIDAVCFFALEVFPKIQQKYPDATFSIVGAKPGSDVLELSQNPGIIVTGTVPSIVDYLHQATVCVVPLRVGLGIKTKTLESMATGIPIVASHRGLEGLTVDGEGVPLRAIRANKIEDYVEAIAQLFEDAVLREQLSHNGRAMIESEYTWERAGQLYEQVFLN
ncbi:MAG TPA: glycosyl transferase family 1 [Cyanobacteria bacterium UBA12227]|nr:glycosyl transferase family 1 [Cyanobacteria bacterium UBA12227]HAX89271.1 glycosyl transferase family 1 [Cyanobacteria bacterium UBA11370]HBY79710.1 glycosyl transferase family 1 [Cyanobacteria bacterium UBA11148]